MSAPVSAISPRSVASKSDKSALLKAIRMALDIESPAVRHNTQTFNRGRYEAVAAIPDYNALKDKARAIKEAAIARLPQLLEQVEASVKRNGGHFFLAKDGAEASRYITQVCREHQVRLLVKGKSMTSEEVHLNHHLEDAGIEVAETDLAEFILQVADEQPSHLIGPAIHYSRERITALFKSKFKTDLPLDTGEELTRFAREILRQKFLNADAGISGANFVTADSGSIVLVESEGNIRLTSQLPPLHIAIAGVEKVLPSRTNLAIFIELLAPSSTGQGLTSYTSILTPPLTSAAVLSERTQKREFHLVLVDNGRLRMREDPVLHEALYCIRCSACLNSCANFQTVGGHAFGGETYSGGIGGSWEAGTNDLLKARFNELCTGCTRCINQCPVRIDIPWLNSNLRERINQRDAGAGGILQKALSSQAEDRATIPKLFFGRYDLFGKWGSRLAPMSNWPSRLPGNRTLMESVFGVDHRRELPAFATKTLAHAARQTSPAKTPNRGRVALFPDIFTNYGSPERGLAAIEVFREMGIEVVVTEVSADGRASLSQGLIQTAKKQAEQTSEILLKHIREGNDIVVIEPSALAMFRLDNRHFLERNTFEEIRAHSFEAVEYLWRVLQERQLDTEDFFPAPLHPLGTRLFYHSHCQQKTIGAAEATESLLRAAGFDVATSRVECCGMAGSFGYKKEFYELSMAVGEDLFNQLRATEIDGHRTLVATGISCQEQLHAGLQRRVFHPMELLVEIIRKKAESNNVDRRESK
ncbi:MAG TPA: LUD domain-containing protein [Terriglobales bacterium]|nr:LUD domain-containing protein [Terriglobales bacterium]